MPTRSTMVTKVCGVLGVATGAALAGLMLQVSRKFVLQGVFAVLSALVFVELVSPLAARLLDRSSAHALWLFPVLGVAALASGSIGVSIANVPMALNGPVYDRFSFLAKPVIGGTLFGAFFALAVGFILGIAATLILRIGARPIRMPR